MPGSQCWGPAAALTDMPRFATVRFAVARSATGTLQMAAILLVERTGRGVCGNGQCARDRALIYERICAPPKRAEVGDWLKTSQSGFAIS